MKNIEIEALKRLSPHEHIIKLLKVLYDEPTSTIFVTIDKLALVFELMDMNLY